MNMNTRNKNASVVVFSGGQDSTTCLLWAKKRYKEVVAVSFDYGQRHKAELECAREIADELDERVFGWIMEYGRADDLFVLINNVKLGNEMLLFVKNQLIKDAEAMQKGEPCSLLAKWMPSINTSSEATRKIARRACEKMGLTEKTYRKTLSKMRQYIDVVEKKMSSGKWDNIDFECVPSVAIHRYTNAFDNRCKEKFEIGRASCRERV